ncbi:sugar nucleotide-binding protein [Candidatus Woesebacteria bacterium]|nr:sugar nucleotide-binding protein [Candidatus Woesebacteria bacterium]
MSLDSLGMLLEVMYGTLLKDNMKPVVAVTGGRGLVGSQFIADFSGSYEFKHLDISDPVSPVDITNFDQVMNALHSSEVAAIVHFAAFTDVTAAWQQRDDKTGLAYKVNVTGTESMVRAANALGAQLIHISTAYVFNGEKEGLYTEVDPLAPIEWYGQTKAWAEEVVSGQANKWGILRIDQPFRPDTFPKADSLHKIVMGLQNNTLYPQFTDHFFGPTYIPDFSKILDWMLRTQTTGLYNASSGEKWNDYQFAQAIAHANGLDETLIKKGSLTEYLRSTERPYQRNTALSTEKLSTQLDFALQAIEQTLKVV